MSSDKDSVKDEDLKVEEETRKDEVEGTKNGADDKSSDESSEKGKKVPPKKRATKAKESKKEVKKEEIKKKEKKKESEDENDGDDDDDDEDDEPIDSNAQEGTDSKAVPLLDQPLELEGTRERKKVQRFTEEFKSEPQGVVAIEIPEGKGDCLGDIPRISSFIQTYRVEVLKPLHKLLYGRLGKVNLIKKNIRKFNGYEFSKGSEQFEKKKHAVSKLDVRSMKSICSVLDLEKKGTRDELITRIAEFVTCPKDSGRPAPAPRPKRSSAQKANKRGFSESEDEQEVHTKSRRGRGKHVNMKEESSSEPEEKNATKASSRHRRKAAESDAEDKESDQEEAEAEEDAEADEQDDAEHDSGSDAESDEPKSKKKAKSNANAKKSPNKKPSPKKTANKKTEKKQTGKKRKEKDDKSEEKDSSSEDEPLSKKSKNPPTDEEIKSYVKEILEGADLDEITMRTVCKKVYDHYPEFDLSHKKDFIKSTVKSLLSP